MKDDKLYVQVYLDSSLFRDPDDIPQLADGIFYYEGAYDDALDFLPEEVRENDIPLGERHWFIFNREAENQEEAQQAIKEYFGVG